MEKINLSKRKDIRLKNYDYSLPGSYFVTICTKGRENVFWKGSLDLQNFFWGSQEEADSQNPAQGTVGANCVRPKNLPLSNIGRIALNELERWSETYSEAFLYSYVIMPNHIHAMVVIRPDESGRPQVAPTLDRMVKQFKGSVTKKVGRPIWQKSFLEHIIRNKQDFETKINYIYENPIRWRYDELYGE